MKHLFVSSLLALILLISFGVGTTHAATAPVTGYAWSSNIGWIQFATGWLNPVTVDTSATPSNFAGYAWSSNIGWISFNANSCGAQAKVDTGTGAVTGWAKAISADGNGWDGCIELSGTNHLSPNLLGTGGVTYKSSDNTFVGYAWGSSVVGWVQFNTGFSNPVTCPTCGGGTVPVVNGTCTAAPSPVNVAPNTTITFTANPTSGTAPYQYSWSGAASTSANTMAVIYATTGSGPTLRISDSAVPINGYSAQISCPNVTVLAPVGNSNIQIGKNLLNLLPAGNTLSIQSGSPFVIKWNATLADTETVTSVTITPATANPGLTSWTLGNVNGTLVHDAALNTNTWSGDTTTTNGGTSMTAGTAASPLTPGLYNFTITFSNGNTTTAKLRITSSSESEF